ncbi:hypothetical protein H311_00450, partial [Anncaliia algerae PRA109]
KDNCNSKKEEAINNLKLVLILNLTLFINSISNNLEINDDLVENIQEIYEIFNPKLNEESTENEKRNFKRKEKQDLLERKVTYAIKKNRMEKRNDRNKNNPRKKNYDKVKRLYEKGENKFNGRIDDKKSKSAKFK